MTAAGAVPRFTRPVPPWTPPLDSDALATVLQKVRKWQVFDGDALLDDVGAVLDDCIPAEDQVDELAQRLRGHLMRLVTIAVAAEAEQRDETAARLVERARRLRTEDVPEGHWKAVGHLRRMGWTVNELLERLVATRCLKEAA
ncbi:DUF6415 family natural product biosynthesis protein [Streptomyces sp. CoT10]|uniref:DUF6415 family natural product biosynthesis protein n=1 Tax=Streptomyces sp. CoT10 TaxID=2875762 RepID=UPI001CD795D7|nr:DUF6415 family natural product biosynthesis protein [Streptomyces sp. CoT10]